MLKRNSINFYENDIIDNDACFFKFVKLTSKLTKMSTSLHSPSFEKLTVEVKNLTTINSIDCEDDEFDFDFDYDPNEMYYALCGEK